MVIVKGIDLKFEKKCNMKFLVIIEDCVKLFFGCVFVVVRKNFVVYCSFVLFEEWIFGLCND